MKRHAATTKQTKLASYFTKVRTDKTDGGEELSLSMDAFYAQP